MGFAHLILSMTAGILALSFTADKSPRLLSGFNQESVNNLPPDNLRSLASLGSERKLPAKKLETNSK